MAQKLFGTDGIRGRANQYPITPEIALKTGRAIAKVLIEVKNLPKRVIIGRDTRISGPMLKGALNSGLASEGIEVIQAGVVPTPTLAHLTQSLKCGAGVMFTASHNPYADNGIKIFGPEGFKLSDQEEEDIEKAILAKEEEGAEPFSTEIGGFQTLKSPLQSYLDHAINSLSLPSLKGFKLVLDCANGAAHKAGPALFEELGATVEVLNNTPDGKNINLDCGALHPEKAAELVKKTNSKLGICLDGDADRVIFIDEAGAVVNGDSVLGLCAMALKNQGKLRHNTLVTTVMSNLGLKSTLESCGIKVESTGVGDRLVLAKMREGGFSLGGENSGHLIFSDYSTTGDGLMSALQVISIMLDKGKGLSELASEIQEYPQCLINLVVAKKPPLETIAPLQKVVAEANASFGTQGRTLLRYSGTENKLRILVEAENAELCKKQAEKIAQVAKENLS